MTMPIPAGVSLSYNGFVFPSSVRTEVTEEPVESGDGRMIKWSKITIKVSGYFTQDQANSDVGAAGAPIDSLMRVVRLQLQANGKNLQYVSKGYGSDLNVNARDGSGVRDVNLGPKPGRLWWKSLGGAPDGCHGAMFSWEVSTCVPECLNASYSPASGRGVFNEISFSVKYATDETGLVVITTSGKASIPLSLRANNTIDHNIDEYFSGLVKPVPEGFLRHIDRTISADRASVNFSITDKQIETPYPNDVVHMEMKHRIKQTKPYNPIWNCSISGTVRMAPTAPKALAWRRFFAIAAARIAWARVHFYTQVPGHLPSGPMPNTGNVTRPQVDLMEEDIFTNTAQFSIRYNILGAPMARVIMSSGLWQPIMENVLNQPEDFWTADTWRGSLSAASQAPTGILGAVFSPRTAEVIIDVCNQGTDTGSQNRPNTDFTNETPEDITQNSGVAAGSVNGYNQNYEPAYLLPPNTQDDDGENQFEPETSWIAWKCEVQRITDYRIIRHKPLGGSVIIVQPTVDPLGGLDDVAGDDSEPSAGWSSDTSDIIQRTSSPSMVIRLIGYAVRVAYRANAPRLITYGGVKPQLLHEDIREETLAQQDGVTFFRTAWVIDYILPSAPSSLPLPTNPFIKIEGG